MFKCLIMLVYAVELGNMKKVLYECSKFHIYECCIFIA